MASTHSMFSVARRWATRRRQGLAKLNLLAVSSACLLIGWSGIAAAAPPAGIVHPVLFPPAPVAPKPPPAPKVTAADVGRALFFDTTLSTPVGQACASCHSPDAGFTFPQSAVNELLGPVPGAVAGRFGNRKPPTISYAAYLPKGPPQFTDAVQAFSGGLFWDGRAPDLAGQVPFPLQNPNEMNNLVHNTGSPALVVSKVAGGPNSALFRKVYGSNIFNQPTATVFQDICQAIAAYEELPEVSPFTSKYDAWAAGKATLTASELNGLRLATGSTTGRPGGPPHYKFAQCVLCHGIPAKKGAGPDLWTNSCYSNIGIPRNSNNPFYRLTNSFTDPVGYNPQGEEYVDLGLGGTFYPGMKLPPGNMGAGNNGQGDFLAINGTFKAPTLRNVDKRPTPHFVKDYMHNGVFKSLQQVVHFYNTRNHTTDPGEIIDFTEEDPYAHLHGDPLWPDPEFLSADTLQNVSGDTAANGGQVGNLGLTAQEEIDIVNFLGTLSDGWWRH